MNYEDMFKKIEGIKEISELSDFIDELRVLSVNEKNDDVQSLINRALDSSSVLNDKKSMVKLYDLKIRQLYSQPSNLSDIESILEEMKRILSEIDYLGGSVLVNLLSWYIEKLKGNNIKSTESIEEALRIISQSEIESYVYYSCKYAYGVEIWLLDHNIKALDYLEECVSLFLLNGLHRSLVQTLGVLIIIYQRTQNKEKAVKVSKQLFSNRHFFDQQPTDVQAIAYYLAGVGQLLVCNLGQAENLFNESYCLLNLRLEQSSYYSYYYIRLLSHLATIQALKGKIEQSYEYIKKIENLLKDDFLISNMDIYSKKQVPHTLNLIKFYAYSRLYGFKASKVQSLIKKIYRGIEDNYNDSVLLNEFILNAELDKNQLEKLLVSNNASLKRIRQIVEFTKERLEADDKKKIDSYIQILNKGSKKKGCTFVEQAYFNLLLAQELFKEQRYLEIYPLLQKYANRLNQIEVLELRFFMEAFIQVGAYKNGDPLGPALQYMVIKKCRMYGFSRLENTLLNYLQLQQKEIGRTI